MNKPLPCPFCGDDNTVFVDEEEEYALGGCYTAHIECKSCLARGPVVGTEDAITEYSKLVPAATKGWNERERT